MEAIFVFTHAVMAICLVSILYMSIHAKSDDETDMEKSAIASPTSKARSLQVLTTAFLRIAVGCIAAFINSN